MLLVLSPLSQEMKAIQRGLEKRGFLAQEEKIGRLSTLHFKDLGFHLAQGGHGKTQFAIQAQYLVQQHEIQNAEPFKGIVCVGCAGGLHPSVKVFDVVVGSKTIEHDFNLRFIQKPLPEFTGDKSLLSLMQALKPKDFQIHIAPIASGDEDVVEADRVLKIHQNTNALAVAWEGAGGARVAKFNKLSFLEVRGITDMANSLSLEHVLTNVEKAMDHVCETLVVLPSVRL